MTESQKMLEIIHQNCKNQRIKNVARAKKKRKKEIVNNILIFLTSSIFMFGLLFLISVIENMRF